MSFNPNSASTTTAVSHNSSGNSNANSNAANSLSLEPNPFEQSFAKNDSLTSSAANSATNLAGVFQSHIHHHQHPQQHPQQAHQHPHQPHLNNNNTNNAHQHHGAPQIQLPAGSPSILTPGGRRHILPPLHNLSPNNIASNPTTTLMNQQGVLPAQQQQHQQKNAATANAIPETPGTLWSTIAGTFQQPHHTGQQHPSAPTTDAQQQHHAHAPSTHNPHNHQAQQLQQQLTPRGTNSFLHRRTGLTPNESGMRTGLTPGGAGFLGSIPLPGLSTPSSLLNLPSFTPGIGSILDNLNQPNAVTAQPQTQKPMPLSQPPQQQQQSTIPSAQAPQALGAQRQQAAPLPPSNGATAKRQVDQSTDNGAAPAKKKRGPKGKAAKQTKKEKEQQAASDAKSEVPQVPPMQQQPIKDEVPSPSFYRDSESSSPGSVSSGKKKKDPMSENDKRKNFLERNRLAASKCRQRKKVLVNKMKEELDYYSSEYTSLTGQVNTLREQVITLRTILYGHKECQALLESVGGADTLNTILNATNYASQISPQRPLEPTIVPYTTTIAPIEEQSKLQQTLLNNNNPSIATAAAVAVTTNNALNQLQNNQPPLINGNGKKI